MTHKKTILNLTHEDGITLSLSNTDHVRGTYIANNVRCEMWDKRGGTARLMLSQLIAIDGGGCESADVWINTEDGRIRKIVTRAHSKDSKVLNNILHRKEDLRGCSVRAGDFVYTKEGAADLSILFLPDYKSQVEAMASGN